MPSPTDIPTLSELLRFAESRQDSVYETLFQGKPFQVLIKNDEIYFRPVGSVERHARTARVNEVLEKLKRTASWKPGDYSDDSFNASYLLSLIRAWQSPERAIRPHPSLDASHMKLTSQQHEEIKSVVKSALRPRDCVIREGRLVHGFQIDLRPAVKNKWVGSVYWGENNPGNDVEIAFDPMRLALSSSESAPLHRWFKDAALRRQSAVPRNHSGDNEAWFRAGFRFIDAVEFFKELAKQTDPLTHNRDRWVLDVLSSQPSSGAELRQEIAVNPEEISLEHMLTMAKSACTQSGTLTTSVAKEKVFKFESDAQFKSYVAELLAKQNKRCAITNLPLLFPGSSGDEDQLPSLDRINSDGHYEIGNLQIVCRFINRWKSDSDDHNFRRLISMLRQAPEV